MGRSLRAASAFATALTSDDGALTGVVVHAASPSAIARKTARHSQFAFITMNFKNNVRAARKVLGRAKLFCGLFAFADIHDLGLRPTAESMVIASSPVLMGRMPMPRAGVRNYLTNFDSALAALFPTWTASAPRNARIGGGVRPRCQTARKSQVAPASTIGRTVTPGAGICLT